MRNSSTHSTTCRCSKALHSHTNGHENETRNITGILTTSSSLNAKQNSIKLTDSNELIPTQSVQEIDFFLTKHQSGWSTKFPDNFNRPFVTIFLQKYLVWTNFPGQVRFNSICWYKASATSHQPIQMTFKPEGTLTDDGELFLHYSPHQVNCVMTKHWYESHLWLAHEMMNATLDLTWL